MWVWGGVLDFCQPSMVMRERSTASPLSIALHDRGNPFQSLFSLVGCEAPLCVPGIGFCCSSANEVAYTCFAIRLLFIPLIQLFLGHVCLTLEMYVWVCRCCPKEWYGVIVLVRDHNKSSRKPTKRTKCVWEGGG